MNLPFYFLPNNMVAIQPGKTAMNKLVHQIVMYV